eukprot:TRINITY_DN3513_c0_g1_i1.p1 TRINITY_DN3513_c0_g1~~TRINITY_DN3513_c0_g1_i1.p1  ORF type:complete len:106 (-),score=16.25 TRINITY_DN3513_c0_g1_i1:12-329(-)
MREECGIEVEELEERGQLLFQFRNNPQELLEVHVFKVLRYQGVPAETEEMRPQWYGVDSIPYQQMWSDDPHWMPQFLANRKFQGYFLYEDEVVFSYHYVNIVEEL